MTIMPGQGCGVTRGHARGMSRLVIAATRHVRQAINADHGWAVRRG